MRSIESEYKLTKVKAAVKLYSNRDDIIFMIRAFEEKWVQKGRRSLKNGAIGISLELKSHTQRFTMR